MCVASVWVHAASRKALQAAAGEPGNGAAYKTISL